jgi:hypothetical protein
VGGGVRLTRSGGIIGAIGVIGAIGEGMGIGAADGFKGQFFALDEAGGAWRGCYWRGLDGQGGIALLPDGVAGAAISLR